MGDCGRIMQVANCATAAAQDMSDARDIVRRFEQLETQWMSFQKRSTKLEGDKDTAQTSTTSPPREKCAVSSAASSYSNPLFTNHSTAKSAQTSGEKTSSSSSRTCNLYPGSEMKSDRAPFSCLRQRKPGALATSPRGGTTLKDDHSSSLISPSTSAVDSTDQNSEKAFKDGPVSPSRDARVTRSAGATFFRDKPPLGPAVQTMSKAPNIGIEKYVSCASSVARHTFRKRTDHRRELQSSFKQQDILGLECPLQSTSMARSSNGDEFRESDAEMIESLHSITYPSTSDPGTYSPGNGSSESHPSSSGLGQSSDAHIDQSRSPPSAPQTSASLAASQLNPALGYDGVSDRNISWRVLGERGVLSEGSFKMDRRPPEHQNAQCMSEDENSLSNDKLIQNVTGASSKDGKLLKLDSQVEQKSIFEPELEKPSDRLDKVNWELRLSKREAALRIAEEKILEEEQNISQARLAVSRCEDVLRQREQDLQQESEKQKVDLGESLKSIETGKTVMKKLSTGLRDVLWHLEQKEKVLQNTWIVLKDSVGPETVFGDHSFGFEPELSLKDKRSGTFDGISFLTAEGKCEEWCSTVVGICERLVTYMSRETHLQKWASVLEREGIRMGKMAKEMAKAKEAANEQCARSEDMMKCAEEQAACMDEERVKLARERDNLILWVTHLQERRKAVAECEREAAKSLAEVQKKAADLFVHESNIDERALEISALQEELRVTSQRLQDDQELINREKHKVQEKMRLVAGRERDVDSRIIVMKKLQEDLNTKAEQVEKDRVDEKRKEILLLTFQETEERINAKEKSVRELEKELKHKATTVEDREKMLAELQLHMENERSKIQEVMTGLEVQKERLKEAEEAVVQAHCSKKNAEEAWARTAQERRETSDYLKSVEDRLKQREEKLLCREKDLQGQQKKLQEIENQAREEQEQSEALHAKLVEEQESWTQELKAKQESLTKRNRALDAKEEEINNDLDRLTEERRVALEDIKRLAEMEARAWGAERDLQAKHDEHLKEVRKHASDYNTQVEDLTLAKHEVKKEFEELRAKKQELKIWQREAEETLQNRIDSFVKGKEELTAQIKELKKLQTDIEQAGSQIIDRVAELDQASNRLERQRHKVETSKKKLEALADKLATHQEVLKRRECDFLTQESKLVAVQNGLKKMAAEAATKEKSLKCREQAVIDGENDLHDVEARLANERKDLEKMLAEVEQHAAKLKEETTSAEEISRSRTRDELLIEERREQLQSKERELAEFETDLKRKAKSLEEHGQTISKLEMQVKERLQRAVEFETKSEELEKGWKQYTIKREALNRTETELQKRAEEGEVHSEMDEQKRKVKMPDEAHRATKSSKREAHPDYHVPKELKTEDVLVRNQVDEVREDRLKHMEGVFQKEAAKISQERANLKAQQQDLEETRKAVEEVKLTLESQLKATKEIVAGASLTAQNASREREALEEERKRLAQDRKDAEASAAAKEEKLAMEAKHLETVKGTLEQEKAKAMEMIQHAAQRAMSAEHARTDSKSAQRDSNMLHKEIQCEARFKDREKELYSTVETIRREKREERAQVTFLDDALEREQMGHPHFSLKNPTKVDALINHAENQMAWKEMSRERFVGEGNSWDPTSEVSPTDRSRVAEQEFSFSTMRSASEINGAIGDYCEGPGRHTQTYRDLANLANYIVPKTDWNEALGPATSSINVTHSHITPEKMAVNSSSRNAPEKNGVPSQKRLENVMTSLMQARQASRSRLQRTKNALLAFPPSSGFIIQVQQALNALSGRLSLMEQIEEGLESHLRNAYETELPESERVLVDKVQLLCRMEEQQSLRVEWEEDMQRQLETISMLQAASRSSPSFGTPSRDPNHGAPPMNDWQNQISNAYEDGNGHNSYEMMRSGGNADMNTSADFHNGVGSRPSKQFLSPNWNKVFEPSDDFDSKGFSNSPLVNHQEYLRNPVDQHCNDLGELQHHQKSTRRKLLLSPPQVTYA